MALDDTFTQRQPYARSRVLLARVQPRAELEDAMKSTLGDADSVVGNRQQPRIIARFHGYGDAQAFVAAELDRIPHQILEQMSHLAFIADDRRERRGAYLRLRLLNRRTQAFEARGSGTG